MKRYGQIIQLKPEKEQEYKELHKKIWPEIEKLIYECNLRNYSIFLKDGLLFAYFEYIGDDFEKDMEKMASNEKNKEWWSVCKPCQNPIESAKADEWWSDMEEVFHQD
jgi:L-rhamnose mutarotase